MANENVVFIFDFAELNPINTISTTATINHYCSHKKRAAKFAALILKAFTD